MKNYPYFNELNPQNNPYQNFPSFEDINPNAPNVPPIQIIQNSYIPQNSQPKRDLRIYIATWNVSTLNVKSTSTSFLDYTELIFPSSYKKIFSYGNEPDMLFIGLQQITSDYSQNSKSFEKEFWKIKILSMLGPTYTVIKEVNLFGVALFFYSKLAIKDKIKEIHTSIFQKKTGFIQGLCNKGFCFIQFEYMKNFFIFSSGEISNEDYDNSTRIEEIKEILSMNIDSNWPDLKLVEHDFWFIFGDMKFRSTATVEESNQCLNTSSLEVMKTYDQYIESKDIISPYLREGEIKFYPTYRFKKGTNEYKIEQHGPSWNDRILFKKDYRIKQRFYDRVELNYAEHKPVVGLFDINFI